MSSNTDTAPSSTLYQLPFTKMHGLGNDFVVLDFTKESLPISDVQFAQIADRRFGIGCDQILIVETSDLKGVDFKYRIHNANGSEVGQCGNGARCFAAFVRSKGLTDQSKITVTTKNGLMTLELVEDGLVKVNMGRISFMPSKIPFVAERAEIQYEIDVNGVTELISVANIGNPHAMLVVDSFKAAPVEEVGKQLESHPRFPERVNVGFMQKVSDTEINLRVFERGTGETLACGSGACAAVAMSQRLGIINTEGEILVNLPGGSLRIEQLSTNEMIMTGPAKFTYSGEYPISIGYSD